MIRNYRLTDTTKAYLKWKRCIIIHNNNKVTNQPEQCKKLHNLYENLVKKNIKYIK